MLNYDIGLTMGFQVSHAFQNSPSNKRALVQKEKNKIMQAFGIWVGRILKAWIASRSLTMSKFQDHGKFQG